MAQTATSWLTDLTNKYTPSSSEFDAARSHRASIEARLDDDLGVREMFEIGSLRHGTGVWYYSDADFLVSLKGVQPQSPWTMLNKVKQSLQYRFPSTTVEIRRPAVVCKFSDATVEIVPAYESSTSGYSIADPAGLRWPVEEDFRLGKGSLGLDQCQARLYTAIQRHIVPWSTSNWRLSY